MMFCVKCGNKTEKKAPSKDSISREICMECGNIHYSNPKIIVGVLPAYENKILLCKRNIEPGYGKWTIPSGFMELGESLEEGAKREAFEEANLDIKIKSLYSTYSIKDIGQVYILFLGEILNNDYAAMDETSEVKLFKFYDIPWTQIAFSSVTFSLRRYISDFNNGRKYKIHTNYLSHQT
jgi:ADP-ribose pyrophosphatase YjhB (NUDIX family)